MCPFIVFCRYLITRVENKVGSDKNCCLVMNIGAINLLAFRALSSIV